jgi:hypothetical protein
VADKNFRILIEGGIAIDKAAAEQACSVRVGLFTYDRFLMQMRYCVFNKPKLRAKLSVRVHDNFLDVFEPHLLRHLGPVQRDPDTRGAYDLNPLKPDLTTSMTAPFRIDVEVSKSAMTAIKRTILIMGREICTSFLTS